MDLDDCVEVVGRIPFEEVVNYHNKLDVFLNVSIDDSESFGVATVEAMACETPVVVTDVGGLMEVVNQGEFGIIVKKNNPHKIADAISDIVKNKDKYKGMAQNARQHVLKNYDWQVCLDKMVLIYKNVNS